MNIQTITKKILLGLICFGFIGLSGIQAQISIQYMPALNGQSVNGLFTAQLLNNSAKIFKGTLKITVRDSRNKIVVVAVTPSALVTPGGNLLAALASQSRIQFGNSLSINMLSQTGRFPEDEYEYCFEFTGTENKIGADEQVFENCFTHSIEPVIPLSLVYPGEGDEICNTRPEFTWQPAMPLQRSLRYRLIVAEKKDKQQAADALMNSIPVFQQDNIAGFILPYPPQVRELNLNKKYVWQVIAYEGNLKVTQSEIWDFDTRCEDSKIDSLKESYRELSSSLNGNFYLAANTLRFAIINPYNKVKMDYTISDLSDPAKKISNLPGVNVATGFNKIDIQLEDVKGIELNKMYLLRINNIGNQTLLLRFIYKGDGIQE